MSVDLPKDHDVNIQNTWLLVSVPGWHVYWGTSRVPCGESGDYYCQLIVFQGSSAKPLITQGSK